MKVTFLVIAHFRIGISNKLTATIPLHQKHSWEKGSGIFLL